MYYGHRESYSPIDLHASFYTMELSGESNAVLIFINDIFTQKSNSQSALIFITINIWFLFALIRWNRPW